STKSDSGRSRADRMDVGRTTGQRHDRTFDLAEKYPFMRHGWTQAEILQAGQLLDKQLTEAEGLRLVPFLSEPGVPADVALRILNHTAMFKPADRARLLDRIYDDEDEDLKTHCRQVLAGVKLNPSRWQVTLGEWLALFDHRPRDRYPQ